MTLGVSNKNGHALKLMTSLESMRCGRSICDFTITVQGRTFFVHRAVLAACSDYFKAMFSNKMKESVQGHVDLKEIDVESFQLYLDYVYTGEAGVTMENCHGVLLAADMLQCEEIKDECLKFLKRNMSVDDCLHIKLIAENLRSTALSRDAEEFAIEHFSEVLSTRAFQALEIEVFLDLVRKAEKDGMIIWRAVVSWINANDNRATHLQEIFQFFDFEMCSFQFLFNSVWRDLAPRAGQESCKMIVAKSILSVVQPSDISEENCFEVLNLTHQYGEKRSNETVKLVCDFITQNFGKMSLKPQFLSLKNDDIMDIFCGLNWWSTEEWRSLVAWVKKDGRKRKNCLISILKNSNALPVNFDFVYNTMLKDKMVKKSKPITSLVVKLLFQNATYYDVSVSNWLHLLQLIKTHEVPESLAAENDIFDFVSNNFKQIVAESDFLTIQKEDLVHLVRTVSRSDATPETGGLSNTMNAASEDDLWKAVKSWIKHDKGIRTEYLPDILEKMNLENFSFQYMYEKMLNDPTVHPSRKCQQIVAEAIFSVLKYENLSSENCFSLLRLPNQGFVRNTGEAINIIHDFLKANFNELYRLQGFLDITQGDIMHLLKSPDLDCSEETKWDASLRWLKADVRNKGNFLSSLLMEIKLENLEKDFIKNIIFEEPLVKKSGDCKTIIIDALLKPEKTPPSGPMKPCTTGVIRGIRNLARPEQYQTSSPTGVIGGSQKLAWPKQYQTSSPTGVISGSQNLAGPKQYQKSSCQVVSGSRSRMGEVLHVGATSMVQPNTYQASSDQGRDAAQSKTYQASSDQAKGVDIGWTAVRAPTLESLKPRKAELEVFKAAQSKKYQASSAQEKGVDIDWSAVRAPTLESLKPRKAELEVFKAAQSKKYQASSAQEKGVDIDWSAARVLAFEPAQPKTYQTSSGHAKQDDLDWSSVRRSQQGEVITKPQQVTSHFLTRRFKPRSDAELWRNYDFYSGSRNPASKNNANKLEEAGVEKPKD